MKDLKKTQIVDVITPIILYVIFGILFSILSDICSSIFLISDSSLLFNSLVIVSVLLAFGISVFLFLKLISSRTKPLKMLFQSVCLLVSFVLLKLVVDFQMVKLFSSFGEKGAELHIENYGNQQIVW